MTLAPLVLALVVQAPASPAGHWEGAIKIPGQELAIVVDLRQDGGGWKGDIDIPAQGARDLALVGVAVDGAGVGFGIDGVPGAPRFEGTVSEDGARIEGRFSQAGQTFPFALDRRTPPDEAAKGALDGFGAVVESALADWKVPGAAVAVVKDGKVVLCEGYGLRDVEKKLPVTRDTLFAIGSTTKAFTATLLAMLVEDGKLEWDEPVTTYLPGFRLKDAFARERLTPRDLVTHRSGLPGHDLVWYNTPLSRRELVAALAHLEPSADLREKFQYQNLMFMAAGYLAGEVAGTTWEDLVRRRILQPLGMKSSTFSVEDSKRARDAALPYKEKDGAPARIQFRNIDAVGPAGAINSSAAEMTAWLRFNLARGTVDSTQLLGARALAEVHAAQIPLRDDDAGPELRHSGYAMGWATTSYRNHRMLHHSGGIDGFVAHVALLPDENLGVVVLSNAGDQLLPSVLARTIVDRVLGLPAIDWNGRMQGVMAAARASKAAGRAAAEQARKPDTTPAHPFDEYAGDYAHPAYGLIQVTHGDEKGLAATFHGLPMRLQHWHYETFAAQVEDPAFADERAIHLTFGTNSHGDVDRVSALLEPAVPEIAFLKKPPARLSDPAFLESLQGTYVFPDAPGLTATVARRGETVLTLAVPGQPVYVLEPATGTEFVIEGLTGYRVRFVLAEGGAVEQVLFVQPDGVFVARPKAREN